MKALRSMTLVILTLFLGLTGPLSGEGRPGESPAEPSAADPCPPVPASTDAVRDLVLHDRLDEAEEMARSLLRTAESTNGRDSVEAAEASDALVETLAFGRKAWSAEAAQLADRAISIRETSFGPLDPRLSASLGAKGKLLEARGRYAESRPLLERALALREGAFGPDDLGVGRAHDDLAELLLEIDLEASEKHGREALRIFEAAAGPSSLEASDALDTLAVCETDQGRFPEAEELVRRSLRISEETLGPRSSHAARRRRHLGGVYFVSGDYERAREELEKAVSITEAALGPAHPSIVRPLTNLAIAEDLLGMPAAANYERAIALADETMGPDHDVPARIRANYAGCLGDSDFGKARKLLEDAQAVVFRSLGPEHPQYLWVTSGLGEQAALIGDFEAAERYFDQAIAGLERSNDAPAEFLVSAIEGLASCRAETGRLAEARALYERALALGETRLGPDHPRVVEILVQLGDVFRRQGALGVAGTAYGRAMQFREKGFGRDKAYAEILFAFADLRAEEGRFREALALFRRAVGILGSSGEPGGPGAAGAYRKYASCLLRSGRPRAALTVALKADSISRRHLRSTVAVLSERNALSLVAKTPSGLDLALSAATPLRDPPSASAALDALVRSRALVLDEMGERHRALRASAEPGVAALFAAYVAARDRLARLAVKGGDEASPAKYHKRLDEARGAKDAAERALAEKSIDFRQSRLQAAAGLAEVSRALPPASALVSFVRHPLHAWSPTSGRDRATGSPVETYTAFVLRSGRTSPVLISLGPASRVDAKVDEARSALAAARTAPPNPTGRVSFGEAAFRRTSKVLRDLVWVPLMPHLEGAKTVFLVPDGSLQLVSFAALPEEPEGYLVETGPVLHYLSAERDLIVSKVPPGTGALVVGAPDFDERPVVALTRPPRTPATRTVATVASAAFRGALPSCRDFDSIRFEPLPSAGREIAEVAEAWRSSPGSARGTGHALSADAAPLLLAGTSASETAVKLDSPGRRFVHLATHGFFLGDCRAASDVGASRFARSASVFRENPLLQSGLALAGANRRKSAEASEDDGILTGEEIAALDLSGVEWAVLSACETGMGELRSGEGLFGLRRAFQLAGARSVIVSLWDVEDEASLDWMSALYKGRLERGLTTAEAVREASREQLRKRRAAGLSTHPVFWAGFVATGDWR